MKVRIYVAVFEDGSVAAIGGTEAGTGREASMADMREIAAEAPPTCGGHRIHVVEAEVPDFVAPPAIKGALVG